MDLQTRKLNAIKYLVNLQDEETLIKIETTIVESLTREELEMTPFTSEQLIDRAKKSDADYAAGKFKTQDQVEKESQNW